MQRAYISKLLEIAEKDHNVLHLLADSGTGFDEMFRRNFPDQIYNFGIAEENMVGAAAGLARLGKIPFVYTAGAFLAYRSFEFIRDDVCLQNLNVKIVGMGAGFAWSSLGPTHHTTEDLGALRTLPNLVILSPASPKQVAACTQFMYDYQGPVYMKIGMNNEKEFFNDNYLLPIMQNEVIYQGGTIPLYTTGSILEEAYDAAILLKNKDINLSVINVHTVKPFDKRSVIEWSRKTNIIFTVEEQSIIGGIGSAISEIVAEEGLAVKVKRIGLNDMFGIGYGTQKEVRAQNNLDANGIVKTIIRYLNE